MKRKKMKFILCLNMVFFLCLAGWVMAGPQGEPGCMEVNSVLLGSKCGPPIETDGNDGLPYSVGPAPNSGDGVSDGSGFDADPNGSGKGSNPVGPAPNSGDGIPDGSGF